MKLSIRIKLLLFTTTIITITAVSSILGASYLIYSQTTSENVRTLHKAVSSFEQRFNGAGSSGI